MRSNESAKDESLADGYRKLEATGCQVTKQNCFYYQKDIMFSVLTSWQLDKTSDGLPKQFKMIPDPAHVMLAGLTSAAA